MRDRDVRTAVFERLEDTYRHDPSTRIVHEMHVWAGSARIDIAVINGELCGYELKSDRDTLERLPTQVEIYNLVFDKMTLVVGSRHAEKALLLIPEWWSAIVATQKNEEISLDCFRAGQQNPAQNAVRVAELLWKEEAIKLLAHHGLERGWKSKRIRLLHERLAECLPLETLKDGVRSALKARKGWLGQH